MMGAWLVAGAAPVIKVTCAEIFGTAIGTAKCSNKTPDLSAGLANIVSTLIVLVGMLAVIFVIISGLQIALSAGDAKRYQQGRDGLQYSVVGVVLALMAYALVRFISDGF